MAGYVDAVRLGAIEAVKMRFPKYAPDDALPYIAAERSGLDRYPWQTLPMWRASLLEARPRWLQAGTYPGMIEELERYFAPLPTTIEVLRRWDIEDTYGPTAMSSHADPLARWDEVWVVLRSPLPWAPLVLPFTLGPTTLGSTASANDLNRLKRTIRKWKPAEALPAEVYILFSGNVDFASIGDPFTPGTNALRIPFAKLLGYPGTDTLGGYSLGGYHLGDGQA